MTRVRQDVDVLCARLAVRSIARAAGMEEHDVQEMAIVVSELAWNLIKHAGGGELEMGVVDHPDHGPGVTVATRDEGPPIHDLAMAIRDGCDDRGPIDPARLLERGGLGGGLGGVLRLTDDFRHEALPNGKRIEVVRYVQRPALRANATSHGQLVRR
ncbi:MAG: ATP-binding protein [Myxococcota bacterium]